MDEIFCFCQDIVPKARKIFVLCKIGLPLWSKMRMNDKEKYEKGNSRYRL
jgi:hypothetical protein